ncbi:MAG: hypothetical protein QOG94_2734 [Solirubrobacteraceae bacterium]|jgi:hypothetical protein|nr:hypothetical protein [Solirubrobacteraceae bacterium]MEA2138594.1 hypothetical protein [Solirubrobacteraceae bacterium]
MSPHLRRPQITTLAVLSCLALTAVAGVASGAQASLVLRTTRACTPPKYPGAGYFTGNIRARNVTCAYAKRFVVEYYKCRVRHGGTDGRCVVRVRRFKCSETRNKIPTEIDARVTCIRGTQRIVHTYQQNLD